MMVLCGAIRRNIQESLRGQGPALEPWLQEAQSLLPMVRTPRRADFHATKAWLRAAQLDVDGALAEVLDALSCRPDPEVGCRARVLRAQLLGTIDPMVSWHEALRVVETARDYGLLRYEVVAWGLAANAMVYLGRADEVIERLRSGVQRLKAHGEQRAAHSAQLHLGLALMAAGRENDAYDVWTSLRRLRTGPMLPATLDATACLGLLGIMQGKDGKVRAMQPKGKSMAPASAVAWRLMSSIVDVRLGEPKPSFPANGVLSSAVALGMPGMFLARLLVTEADAAGYTSIAEGMSQAYDAECARLGVDPDEALPWVERARRSRRS